MNKKITIKSLAIKFLVLSTLCIGHGSAYAISYMEDGGGGGGGGGGIPNTSTPTPTPTATQTATAIPTETATPAPTHMIVPTRVPVMEDTIEPTIAPTPQPTPAGEEDLCPNDPLKTSPGVCGCGTPDNDDNANAIIDCDITAEFAYIAASIKTKLGKLVAPPYKKAVRAEQRSMRRSILNLSKSLVVFAVSSNSEIHKSSNVNLLRITRQASKRARRAARSFRSYFKSNKIGAIRGTLRVLRSVNNGLEVLGNPTL